MKKKKLCIAVPISLVIVMLVVGIWYTSTVSREKRSIKKYQQSVSKYTCVDINDLVFLDEKSETFVVYFGKSTCPACWDFVERLNNIPEHLKTKILYFDTSKKDNKGVQYLKNNAIFTVPTLMLYENGKHSAINKDLSAEKLEKTLRLILGERE